MLATKEIVRSQSGLKTRRRRLGPTGAVVLLGLALLAANFIAQLVLKPSEVLGLAGMGSTKTPRQTWAELGPAFQSRATRLIAPEFLAALAQVESSGDPFAGPPWRWRWTTNPLRLYGPASTAVGLMQITDGNFKQARVLCVKNGRVARDGPWSDPDACRLTGLYSRLAAADAIEMTSAFLHLHVSKLLAKTKRKVSVREREGLAAVIHLCGPEKGPALVRANFNADALGSCGEQAVGPYVRQVLRYRAQFSRMAL